MTSSESMIGHSVLIESFLSYRMNWLFEEKSDVSFYIIKIINVILHFISSLSSFCSGHFEPSLAFHSTLIIIAHVLRPIYFPFGIIRQITILPALLQLHHTHDLRLNCAYHSISSHNVYIQEKVSLSALYIEYLFL
jgi:hypothetical protein